MEEGRREKKERQKEGQEAGWARRRNGKKNNEGKRQSNKHRWY